LAVKITQLLARYDQKTIEQMLKQIIWGGCIIMFMVLNKQETLFSLELIQYPKL